MVVYFLLYCVFLMKVVLVVLCCVLFVVMIFIGSFLLFFV